MRARRHVTGIAAACALCAAIAAVILRTAAPAQSAPQRHDVSVLSNFYSEREVFVSPGDTVVWTAIDQLHTVIADDGRFQYFPLRELDRGQQVQYTFLNEETVRYYCRVHGNRGGVGMSGVIVVGRGGPRPPPPSGPEERIVPSPAYPTINAALAGIPADSSVRVQPGTYNERVVVTTPGVALIGNGVSAADVRIEGTGERSSGVILAAPRTRVERLTAGGQTGEGIAVRGADNAVVTSVRVFNAGDYGILVSDSTGVTVEYSVVSGARIAAVSVKGCADCAATIYDSTLEFSRFGILTDNAGGVTVAGNLIRQNGTGVAARSLVTAPGPLRTGVRIVGNQIADNRRIDLGGAGTEFAVRSGVWLAGAAGDVVEDNAISGHDYGVIVTSLVVPSIGGRISRNTISDSEKADLAWDGIGVNVCFEGNVRPGGAPPSSRPSMAESLYACSAPATVGIPEPTVLADLALYAVSGNSPS